MLDSAKKIWFYTISLLFILANGFLLYNDRFELLGAPVAILLAYLAVFKLDVLYYTVMFLVPLSVNLDDIGIDLGVGMALPTEPLIVGMMLIFVLKLFFDGGFDKSITNHLISKFVILHIVWIGLSSVTSSDPVISIKFLLSRIWFVSVFFFIASQVLKTKENKRKVIWLYVIGLIPVLFYTFYEHSLRKFDQTACRFFMSY